MRLTLRLFFFICFFILTNSLYSQVVEFTENDKNFFKTHQKQFEDWLAFQGLSNLFHIYLIEVDSEDNRLNLILESNFSQRDSTISAWRKFKNDYDKIHIKSLEERLLEKFCFLMEIPLNQCYIEIHHKIKTNKQDGPSCFNRRIFYNNGEVNVKKGGCQTQVFPVEIEDFNLKPELRTTTIKKISLEKNIIKNIKNSIDTLLQIHFEKVAKDDFKKINLGKKYIIANLEKEVLKNVEYTLTQKTITFLGGKAGNYEYLEINIDYKIEDVITIIISIDGKVGNKTFKPRVSQWIDMETEYGFELQTYVQELGIKIRKHLSK